MVFTAASRLGKSLIVFCASQISDEVGSPTEDLDDQSEFSGTNLVVSECEEENEKEEKEKEENEKEEIEKEEIEKEETVEQQTDSPVPCAVSRPKIHSRKFRE